MAMKPILMFDNQFGGSTLNFLIPSSTDADTAFDVNNITDYRPYTRWKSVGSGQHLITAGWSSAITANCIAIIGHNLQSASATTYVEYDGAPWKVASGGHSQITDEAVFFREFAPQFDTSWRLRFETAGDPLELGVVLLGLKVDIERFLLSPFDPEGQTAIAEQSTSMTGELLGSSVKYKQHNITARWSRLTSAGIATLRTAWLDHLSLMKPFIFSWEPEFHLNESQYLALKPGSQFSIPYDPIRQSFTLQMRGLVRPRHQ